MAKTNNDTKGRSPLPAPITAKPAPRSAKPYPGAGDASSTQDANKPITATRVEYVTPKLFIRNIDRSPKDILTLQQSLLAAESVYYPNQQRLFDLYEEVLRDGHLSGIIQKRIDQVLNKTLLFTKAGTTIPKGKKSAKREKVEEMDPVIRSQVFRKIITELMLRKMWGLSAMEFIPGASLAFNCIDRKHIKLKTQKITFEQFGLDDGIDYTELKNIWVLGDHRDFGLLLICAYYALLKRGAISDWATYIELFGSPVMLMKYKGYDPQAQKAAERILNTAGNSMKIAIPEEMGFELLDGKISNGDGKLQETFRLAMNQEMSLVVLGNTETSASGQHGSEGKSKTHSDQQKEIMKADMEYIVDCLNQPHFMDILRSYNLPVDGGTFEFDKEVDIQYLKDFVPVITQLSTQIGLPVSKTWLYDLAGIPEPEDEDDTITLYPTLGQEPTDNDPDEQDGLRRSALPISRPLSKKPCPQRLTIFSASPPDQEGIRTHLPPL